MIFAIFTVIQRYHKKMEDGNLDEKRMASIIGDIDYQKKTCARFYIPLYLLRRAVFMTLVLIFDYDLKFFCFSLLLAHCVAMLVIASSFRPYRMMSMNAVLIFNETMITILMGFSGCFLEKEMNNLTAINLGWVWIAIAIFTIVVNWVMWLVIQIKQILNRKKIKVEEEEAKKSSKKRHENKQPKLDPDNEDPHGFGNPSEVSPDKNVSFVDKSHQQEMVPDSQYTMMTPGKKFATGETMQIDNHYNDQGLYEEEKVPGDYANIERKRNRRKSRKLSDLEDFQYGYRDEPMPFGTSPTKETTCSPSPYKGISSDPNDDVRSVESNQFSISAIRISEVSYNEATQTKKKKQSKRKFSDNVSQSSAGLQHGFLGTQGITSQKNILMRADI
jgi:hypothetical protein